MAKFEKNKKEKNKFSFLKEKLKWLDPFTYVDLFVMPKVKLFTDSKLVENLVNVFFAAIFALLIYLLLSFLFQTTTPLVIVYSASMQPNLFRGDVIALRSVNQNDYFGPEIKVDFDLENKIAFEFVTPVYKNNLLEKLVFENGVEVIPKEDASIIVYSAFQPNSPVHNQPIIHRSIAKIIAMDGNFVLTKGDNYLTNITFDQDCGKIDALRGISEKPCITFKPINTSEIQGVAFGKIPVVGCIKLWLVDNLSSLIFTGNLPKDFSGVC